MNNDINMCGGNKIKMCCQQDHRRPGSQTRHTKVNNVPKDLRLTMRLCRL